MYVAVSDSLVPRPSRDVMMTYLPPFIRTVTEMVADTPSLHHQIDQAFSIFLAYIEKHGKTWVRG